MTTWHVQFPDGAKGPFDDDQLKTLADTGTINAATLVWRQDFSSWRPLAETDYIYKSRVQPPPLAVASQFRGQQAGAAEPELGFFAYGWRALTSKYATFSGRARRKEYWAFWVLTLLVGFVVGVLGAVVDVAAGNSTSNGKEPVIGLVLTIVVLFALFLPSLAVSVRRLHDLGMSGWWALILIVPYVGALIFLVFAVLPGQPHDNDYGPPAKTVI